MRALFRFIRRYSLVLALLWTAVIFGLCCMPGRYIPTTSFLELLSFDKFVHASIFFVLQLLWMLVYDDRGKLAHGYYLVALGSIAYGGLLEIMQATLFSQRSADWFDFLANSFGCVMALVFFRKIRRKLFQQASSIH